MNPVIETESLYLREWSGNDRDEFRRFNSDPEVMRYFPGALSHYKSDRLMNRIIGGMKGKGCGLWAVELKSSGKFIGFIGFNDTTFKSEFTPCIEIGWRLNRKFWGNGYAPEGAKACLSYGFDKLKFEEIYSFTSVLNESSMRVMMKIGMNRIGEFEHPELLEGDRLRRHVLFKIARAEHRSAY